MASTTTVACDYCGRSVTKEVKEVNRSRRKGLRFFCDRSCSARFSNIGKGRAEPVTKICPCGASFVSTTLKKSAHHCSRSCASLYHVTETRREAARRCGRATGAANLPSQDYLLRRREQWKYVELEQALTHRNHQFEFPIEDRVFDLALLDVRVLVEFDGPYHSNPSQRPRDEEKEELAQRYGFVVVRKSVAQASVIGVETIQGL